MVAFNSKIQVNVLLFGTSSDSRLRSDWCKVAWKQLHVSSWEVTEQAWCLPHGLAFQIQNKQYAAVLLLKHVVDIISPQTAEVNSPCVVVQHG